MCRPFKGSGSTFMPCLQKINYLKQLPGWNGQRDHTSTYRSVLWFHIYIYDYHLTLSHFNTLLLDLLKCLLLQGKVTDCLAWRVENESCSVLSNSWLAYGLYIPWNSPGQNPGVVSLSLLHGIFQTQRLNPGLPNCSWILHQLSHKGSQRILEWEAYHFSSRTSRHRNQTGISRMTNGFFPNWAIREALSWIKSWYQRALIPQSIPGIYFKIHWYTVTFQKEVSMHKG